MHANPASKINQYLCCPSLEHALVLWTQPLRAAADAGRHVGDDSREGEENAKDSRVRCCYVSNTNLERMVLSDGWLQKLQEQHGLKSRHLYLCSQIGGKFLHETKDYAFKSALPKYFSEANDIQATIDRFFFGVQGPQRESKRKQIYYWIKQRPHIDKCTQHAALAQQKRVQPIGLGTTLSSAAE
uniref:AlNc14C171G7994 protein n=1 Tax=Albugo laibachii Nc14 TaxID=890382 RepID=F0WNG9_9STRA|nr:AlNc14C171G7994 [Albugo laibachii Nc14]|eukprot:CCA22860.1 AlNc14C171G7994 [Albugo laibachii Nc14]